jgi:2,3-dihydroxyphenylpropionate 1,2-dioxygenase
LQVPAGTASNLVAYLRSDDIDAAISYKMRVDHGFSQPLKRLTGALDRYPTVPVFIGALTPPYLPFRRSRMLGESVGRFVRESERRTLFIGSGGLSHHPTRYYPLVGAGEDKVATYQLEGERGGSFTDEQWLSRLHGMHLEGAEMLVNGQRTRQDIRLNPEMDRRFLEQIQGDDLEAFDGWDPAAIVETAGIGFLELHAWIAAMAAYRAAGGSAPSAQTYVPALEYGIGYGMLSAGLGEHRGQ